MLKEERHLLLTIARIMHAQQGGPAVTDQEHHGHLLEEALKPFDDEKKGEAMPRGAPKSK